MGRLFDTCEECGTTGVTLTVVGGKTYCRRCLFNKTYDFDKIEQATDSELYNYEREAKLLIAHDIIKKLLEDKDGDQVDKDVH